MEAIRVQVQRWIGGLGAWQRAALVGSAVVVVVAVALGVASQRSAYAPLFSGLSAADAADVVARLEEEGVPYRFSEDGKAVLVPAEEVHRLRLLLAADGLPRGGVVGMELLDRFQFGATEFERRMNFLRALQGELTRTIRQVEGVEDARVHIVLPEDALFTSDQQPASAAVLLTLKPGHSLSPDQIAAITYLVAGSVEGLEPEAVTIVDNHGTVLSAPPGDGGALSAGTRPLSNLEMQQQFQSDLQASVQSLLEQVFGPGNVAVRVTAELNFDESVIDRELFQPADPEGLLRSVQELEERFEGTGQPPAFPGTDSNLAIPTYGAGGANQDATYERTESVRNYEINEIRERIVVAPGTVKRLSVSVVVNDQLTPEQVDAVRSTVSAAIGLDPQRNDQISVIGMAFDTSIADQLRQSMAAEEEAARRAGRTRVYAVAAAALLIMIALAVRAVVARRAAARRREEEALQSRLEAEIAKRQASLVPEDDQEDRVWQEVETLARQKPEQLAQILRAWLVEE